MMKRTLIPIGFFWDMENCQVPKGCSAFDLVRYMRTMFIERKSEEEFVVVCDVYKEVPFKLKQLEDAEVNIVHVNSTQKNSADEKLRQLMRKFAEIHPAPSTLVIITGDINFAGDLKDFRYRKNLEVVLIHNSNASKALIACASKAIDYTLFTSDLPRYFKGEDRFDNRNIYISNIPTNVSPMTVVKRLETIGYKFGGKVMNFTPPTATLRCSSKDQAFKATKYFHLKDVCGAKIETIISRSQSLSDDGYSTANGGESCQIEDDFTEHNESLCVFANPNEPFIESEEQCIVSIYQLPQTNLYALSKKITNDITPIAPVLKCIVHNSEFGLIAKVTLRNKDDARAVVAKLHNTKRPWSTKCLKVSIQYDRIDAQILRGRIFKLSSLSKSNELPVNELIRKYALRYTTSITRTDLGCISDVVSVSVRNGEEWATIHTSLQKDGTLQLPSNNPNTAYDMKRVYIDLHTISLHTYILLECYNGSMSLTKFLQSYEEMFGRMPHDYNDGVDLELLLRAIPNISLVEHPEKRIVWSAVYKRSIDRFAIKKEKTEDILEESLKNFERDVDRVLTKMDRCCVRNSEFYSKFLKIHWRPCRLADIGFTKICDIPMAIPKYCVTGSGKERMFTFTPITQAKRWNRQIAILIENTSKNTIEIKHLSKTYQSYYRSELRPTEYGVCTISDLLFYLSPKVARIKDGEKLVLPDKVSAKRLRFLDDATPQQFMAANYLRHHVPTTLKQLEQKLNLGRLATEYLRGSDKIYLLKCCGFYVSGDDIYASDGWCSSWLSAAILVAQLLASPKRYDWVEFEFKRQTGGNLPITLLFLTGVIFVDGDMLALSSTWLIILRILHLKMHYFTDNELCQLYFHNYHHSLPFREIGFNSPYAFLQAFPELFQEVKAKRAFRLQFKTNFYINDQVHKS